jgi:nucleotide-binding universal stress UspA family protein
MYEKMMVPLDGSELAECVLPHVEAFLKGFPLRDVRLVRVVEPVTIPHRDIHTDSEQLAHQLEEQEAGRQSSARRYLEEVRSRIGPEGTGMRTEVLSGRVSERLIDYAEQNHIDLILIATHGRSGVTRWVRGSVADKILHAASVPVFMVRAPRTQGAVRL